MSFKSGRCIIRLSPMRVCVVAMLGFAGACLSLPPTVTAGAAPAVLTCKSPPGAGGVITLSGQIPGDYETFNLKIKRGKEEHEFKSLSAVDNLDSEQREKLEERGVIAKDRVLTLVEDFKRGVFTMALRRGDAYELRLYALPSTIRTRFSPNSTKASFDAMLLEGDIGYRKPVKVRCTYDHSI